MDCFSFVFSLLLIVSVTTFTFGSVIKAKNPYGEDPEKSLLQGKNGLKDQESEMSKQVDPETLLPGTITVASLEARLKTFLNLRCAIAIGIENHSGYEWKLVYKDTVYGTDPDLPDYIPDGKGVDALSYNPLEVAAFPMYDIKGIQSSLTMLYYVSINGNSWNVKMHLDDEPPTYREMLLSSHPADNSWHDDDLGFGLKYRVFMSTSREAILIIKIYKSK